MQHLHSVAAVTKEMTIRDVTIDYSGSDEVKSKDKNEETRLESLVVRSRTPWRSLAALGIAWSSSLLVKYS